MLVDYTLDTNHTDAESFSTLEAPDESLDSKTIPALRLFRNFWSAEYTVPIYLIAILYPISCMREPTIFTKFNALGVCSVFVLLGYVIYRAVVWGINMDVTADSSIRGQYTSSCPKQRLH